MDFEPNDMTYGAMEQAQKQADLCGGCRHREVCPIPRTLAKRSGWFLSVGTCAHYEKEASDGHGSPRTNG